MLQHGLDRSNNNIVINHLDLSRLQSTLHCTLHRLCRLQHYHKMTKNGNSNTVKSSLICFCLGSCSWREEDKYLEEDFIEILRLFLPDVDDLPGVNLPRENGKMAPYNLTGTKWQEQTLCMHAHVHVRTVQYMHLHAYTGTYLICIGE